MLNLSDFKLYYRTLVTRTTRYCQRSKHVDQWNIIENPEINPCIFIHMILDHGAENIHCRKDSLFNNSVEKTGYSHIED
jgi:hypothetical protein